MEECDVVTGLRGVLADMPADSSNGVLCGIIDELKCDVVLIGVYVTRSRKKRLRK